MADPIVAPAPIAEHVTDTYTASQAAVIADDMTAYRDARRAERAGTPKESVEVQTDAAGQSTILTPDAPLETTAPEPSAPETRKTRQEKEQARINTAIRTAVEAETKALRAELERLRPAAPAPAARPDPAPIKRPDPIAELQRYQAMPDAPKAEDFATDADYRSALHLFVTDTRTEEHRQAERVGARQAEVAKAQEGRVTRFLDRFNTAKQEAGWFDGLSPEVRDIRPISGLAPDEPKGPLNVLWEFVYDSPHLAKLASYFSQHPEELRRLEAMPKEILETMPAGEPRVRAHIAWILKEFGKLEDRVGGPPAAAGPVVTRPSPSPKHVSDAPAPLETLGRRPGAIADPVKRAVQTGDMTAYREARRAERAAEFQGTHR